LGKSIIVAMFLRQRKKLTKMFDIFIDKMKTERNVNTQDKKEIKNEGYFIS